MFAACLPLSSALPVASSATGSAQHGKDVTSAPHEREIQQLKLGIPPIEKTLAGGESHSYEIVLAPEQYLHLVIDQHGIDVEVTIVGPDGKRLAEVDSLNGNQGPEPVSWIAEASGTYRLQVRSTFESAGSGRYTLRVVELREATPRDRNYTTAQQAFNEGRQLKAVAESRQAAIKSFETSLPLWRALGDRVKEAQTLNYIAETLYDLDERQKALDFYARALSVSQPMNDTNGTATALSGMASVYRGSGEMQKALGYYYRALPLWHALGDLGEEGISLHNIGVAYDGLGERQKALDYLLRAVPLRRSTGQVRGAAYSLTLIGGIYAELGNQRKAVDIFDQVLQLSRSFGSRTMEANTFGWLGYAYFNSGEYKKALAYDNQALSLWRLVRNQRQEGNILSGIGNAYAKLGDDRKALEYYQQALPLRRAMGDREGEAFTLAGIAYAQREVGHLEEARAQMESALSILESLRSKAPGPELRASFVDSVHGRYEFYIELLMRLHELQPNSGLERLAFEASERFRGRSFLESIAESQIDLRQDLTVKQRQREDLLLNNISAIQKEIWNVGALRQNEEQLKKNLTQAEYALEEFGLELRRTNPRYADLQYPEPLSLDYIQHELLDANTTLLEYVLGEKRSFVWVISRNRIAVAILPPRKEIERQAAAYRETLMEQTSALTVHRSLNRFRAQSRQLYKILIEPLESNLGSSRKAIIVPDGLLAYVPFETLLASGEKSGLASAHHESNGDPEFLLERLSISYVPSASALASIRDRGKESDLPSKGLLAFGDPVYDFGRSLSNERSMDPESAPSFLASYVERGLDIGPLPYSRAETEAIGSLFPTTQRQIYVGTQANERSVKDEKLDQYRYIHFAAHGYVDEERPTRSGILLSSIQDPSNDGILQVSEVMRLRFNADLVTLSACRTGLGKLLNGEGIVGLARAFFYAGTRNLLVSLWNVNDPATAELMTAFYQNLNHGLTKDEALRQAKLKLMHAHHGSWQHPHYWAPFVLVGEAR